MKQTILAIVLLAAPLAGCKSYMQYAYMAPTSSAITKSEDDFYEYKNADVTVRYSFWGEKGVMGFIVYNNTDKPLYIDWKKSSFIVDNKQIPYYEDKVTSNYVSVGSSYGSTWLNYFNRYSTSSFGVAAGRATIVKEEQITFIAPHTYIAKAQYNLVDINCFIYRKKQTRKDSVNGVPAYVTSMDRNMMFRNYLTYSNTEKFENEKYVDNEFEVKKVATIRIGKCVERDDDGAARYKWSSPTKFYLVRIKNTDFFPR